LVLYRRLFSPPGYILSVRLCSGKGAKALISRVPDERFQAQPHRFRVCRGSASGFGLVEELGVDVEGLFHTYDYAIQVWLL
jgi:hypothetical protein